MVYHSKECSLGVVVAWTTSTDSKEDKYKYHVLLTSGSIVFASSKHLSFAQIPFDGKELEDPFRGKPNKEKTEVSKLKTEIETCMKSISQFFLDDDTIPKKVMTNNPFFFGISVGRLFVRYGPMHDLYIPGQELLEIFPVEKEYFDSLIVS